MLHRCRGFINFLEKSLLDNVTLFRLKTEPVVSLINEIYPDVIRLYNDLCKPEAFASLCATHESTCYVDIEAAVLK